MCKKSQTDRDHSISCITWHSSSVSPRALDSNTVQVTDIALPGFTISALLFYLFSTVFPVEGAGDFDDVDVYGTFTDQEIMKMGLTPTGAIEGIEDEKVGSPRVDEVGGDSAKVSALKKWLKG